jgi:hypothetical protein
MKVWALAAGFTALGGAILAAGFAGMRAQASAESATNALVLAERAAPKASVKAATSAPIPAATVAAVAASAPSSVASVAPAVPAAAAKILPATPAPDALSFRKTSTYNGAVVYVPSGCQGAYDVVMHFHGAHPYVKDLLEKADIHAVLAVFNAGNGAEKYSQGYGAGGTLSSLLRQVEMAAAPLCSGADAKPRRVALTAWSAGYGGVEKLLSREEDRDRVDAVLLADGLHAGFTDRWKRTLAPNALQAFRDFGELAKQGKKLFAITHSSIVTDGYASTTECSRFLLAALNVPCDDPLVSGKSSAFSIEGFTGNDKAAHIVQFRQMDATLLSKLRARWQQP